MPCKGHQFITGAPCRMVSFACGRAPETSGKACRQLKGAPGADGVDGEDDLRTLCRGRRLSIGF